MSIPQSGGGPIEHFDQLAEYLAQGEKPADQWRIGTEHEKFGYLRDGLTPLPYEGPASVQTILEGLAARFGWERLEEQGKIIGLTRDGANISLEPGGQLELSGAPLVNLHETRAELEAHLAEVAGIAGPLGVGFASLGAAPVWTHEQMPMMPKGRYRLMTDYMGRVGALGTQMMYRTCTVQVNLDFASEADMVRKMRVALSLQSVATALCASSPFLEGKPNGHKSWRSRIWRDLDKARTGIPELFFREGAGYEAWVNHVLDVPMYFVYRDGLYINALGQSFRDFLKGELPALPGEKPTLSDWADHLTTVFTEARVKKFIEMRGADAGSRAQMVALPALWVGLTYDEAALDAALDLVKPWDQATREGLRVAASVSGLQGEAEGVRLRDVARQVLDIAEAGLNARGLDEAQFLAPFRESVATGMVPADRLLAAYDSEWGGELSPIYAATDLI